MPLIDNFQDFEAFKRSREFVKQVGLLSHSGSFARDLTLVHQNRKALLSILSNFAEGFERDGNQEFRQFLSISKGSVGEVRAHLIYALDQGYIGLDTLHATRPIGRRSLEAHGRPHEAPENFGSKRPQIPWQANRAETYVEASLN